MLVKNRVKKTALLTKTKTLYLVCHFYEKSTILTREQNSALGLRDSTLEWWVFSCFSKVILDLKLFWQSSQSNVFFIWPFLRCWFRWHLRGKRFPQVSHTWGLTFAWIVLCLLRSTLNAKHLPHSSHLNGLIPLWLFISCLLRSNFCAKRLPHSWHSKGLIGEWEIRWDFKRLNWWVRN